MRNPADTLSPNLFWRISSLTIGFSIDVATDLFEIIVIIGERLDVGNQHILLRFVQPFETLGLKTPKQFEKDHLNSHTTQLVTID
jgi:hypothetical protein